MRMSLRKLIIKFFPDVGSSTGKIERRTNEYVLINLPLKLARPKLVYLQIFLLQQPFSIQQPELCLLVVSAALFSILVSTKGTLFYYHYVVSE